MAAKIIKLGAKDDLASVIKQIKGLRDREIILDVAAGSPILQSSDGLKLVKKTGEVLGKKIKLQTQDETGRLIAKKAGILGDEIETEAKPTKSAKVARSDIKPRFSDIVRPKTGTAKKRINPVNPMTVPIRATRDNDSAPVLTRSDSGEQGSRLEFEVAKKSSRFSKIFILCLVILVIIAFGLFILLPQANVTIYGRSEPVSRDFELTVDRTVNTPDASTMQIPGIPVTKEVSQTKSFPTTGTKVSGSKASGTVSIYNNTPNPLKFKVSTTTLVANGKKYLLTKDISGIKPGGVANTGIQIIAEQGGEDYNLPANTKFQIINSALGNANVYAMNPQALSGGATGQSTKVLSQQDLDNAANSLIAEVVASAEADLTTQNSTQIKLIDSGVKKDILAKTANKNVGDATDSFDMTLIAKVSGIAFKENDLVKIVTSKISEVLSTDKYLLTDKQAYTATFKSTDIPNTKGVLDVHFQTTAAYKVDTANIAKILAGKNENEIKEILISKPEVDKVEVKFWPAWFVNKAPKFNGKIYITTILPGN